MIHIVFESILSTIILCWILYSVVVIIYLNLLTNRYLVPIKRDNLIKSDLKSYDEIINQYKDRDTINVLVLSGGGVRGVIPLHILSYIEQKTGKKAGELFDFIAGTSTGAISAAGLSIGNGNGGYKFSARDILTDYEERLSLIFSSPWYHQLLTCFGLFAPRFLPDNKLSVVENYCHNLTIGDLKSNVLIPVYNMDEHRYQMITNWSAPTGKANENFLVKDVVNGGSSPPMLFPPVAFSLNGKNRLFTDPAVLLNNPVLQVLLQVREIFPKKKLNIVSISNGGTAIAKYNYKYMFSFGLYGIYQYLFNTPALSSRLYMEFLEELQHYTDNISFYRIESSSEAVISAVDASASNMQRMKDYASNMLEENYPLVNQLIEQLIDSKLKDDDETMHIPIKMVVKSEEV